MAARPKIGTCAMCRKDIAAGQPALKALDDQFFHKDCMCCVDCKTSLLGAAFLEKNGLPQCEACGEKDLKSASAAQASSCKHCGKKILEGSFVKAFGFSFHNACMVCQVCNKKIANDGFYDDDTDKILHLECIGGL